MFKQKSRDRKDKIERKKRRTGMLLSLFLIFVLIVLSSSFVLRFIYEGAANVEISQYGVESIFRAAMGDTAFSDDGSYYDSTDTYEDYEYQYPYEEGQNYYYDYEDEYLQDSNGSVSDFNENIEN